MLGRVGALNGDLWYDTSTGIAYVKQGGSTLPIGVGSSPVINGTITGTYAFGGTPSLAVDLNAKWIQDIKSGDAYVFIRRCRQTRTTWMALSTRRRPRTANADDLYDSP